MPFRDESREGERATCTTKKALLTLGVAGAIAFLSPETVYAADTVTVDGATVTTSTSSSEQTSLQTTQQTSLVPQSSTGTQGQTTSSPSDTPSDTTSLIQGDVAVLRPEDNYNIGGVTSEPGTEPDPNAVPTLFNASSEVIQPASESVTTQVTIDAAATAVATAGSTLQQTSTTLQEVSSQSSSLSSPSSSITDAVAAAQTSTAVASTAVTNLQTAITNAQTLQDTASASQFTATLAQETLNGATQQLTAATTVLTERTQAVSQQTTIVAEASAAVNTAQSALNSATAAVDAQEVVVAQATTNLTTAETAAAASATPAKTTATFSNSTDITITVGGVVPGTSFNNGAQIQTWGTQGTEQEIQGAALYTNGSSPIVIDVPNNKSITEVGFGIYAKNGDAPGTTTYTDGTTSTFKVVNNVMQVNGVSNPDHTSTQVVTAVTGKYIDKISIAPDYDIYIIDNVYYKSAGTANPALVAAVTTATTTLATETTTLNTLITAETTASQNLDAAEVVLTTEQATLTTLTTQQTEAQATVTTLTNAVTVATQVNDQAQAQATTDQTAATTAANALPALITTANTAITEAQHDVAVAGAVTSVAVAQELVTKWNETSQAAGDAGVAGNSSVVSALNDAATAVNTAITNAQTALNDATAAQTAQSTHDSDVTLLVTAQQTLADTQADFDAAQASANALATQVPIQQTVVDTAQQNLTAAQTVVDANTSQGLTVQVYNVQGQNNAPTLPANAVPFYTTTDTNGINEQWGSGNVAGSNRSEDVIVKYSGNITFPVGGTIRFYAPADDGTKVFINNMQIINDWYDKGGGGSTAMENFAANTPYPFTLWYYENGGGASVAFMWNTGQGYTVVPASAFTSTTATAAQLATLASTQQVYATESAALAALQAQSTAAAATAAIYADELTTATTNVDMYTNEVDNATLASTTAWSTSQSSTTTAINSVVSAEQALANALSVIQVVDAATPPVPVDYSTNEGGVINIAAPQGQIITGITGWYASAYDADQGAVVDPAAFANLVGGNTANISADNGTLLGDPLPGTPKVLYVDVTYENAYIAPVADVVVTQLQDGSVQVTWTPPTGSNVSIERYAISWSTPNGGWGVASTTNSIVLAPELFSSTGGLDTSYNFSVRADNDSLAVYSSSLQTDPVLVAAPAPVVIPDPAPTPQPEPTPDPTPQPVDPTPAPDPAPEEPLPVDPTPIDPIPVDPVPVDPIPVDPVPVDPVPVDPTPVDPQPPVVPEDPTPVDPTPATPEPPAPVDKPSVDNNTPEAEVKAVVSDALADGKLTAEEKAAVVDALVATLAPGEALSTALIAESGIDLGDLPPDTPIELANGVVITAEVGNAFETLANPGELVSAIFTDPGQVLTALTNLGADMSEEERAQSQKAVVAAVIAGGAAIQAAAGAAAAASGSSGGGSSSGGSRSGGGSSPKGGGDGGAPVGREGGDRPRKTHKTKAKIKSPRPRRHK